MSKLARDVNTKAIQVLRPSTVSKVSTSGTPPSSAIAANIRVARIISTVDCFYKIAGPSTTSDAFLPANTIEYVHVYEGDNIAFITAGGTGSAYVTDMV
jgi:hypothetical protein